MLGRNGKNNSDGSFDWKDALIDGAIFAGSTFFAALLVAVANGEILPVEIAIAGITAGVEFFGVLMVKRGLRKQGE